MPQTELPAPAAGAEKPDLAFGAYQRGYFLTALQYATEDAEKGNAPAMTLLGELYANGLGVPRDDQKAADWYKLAAARGDRNAMFALAMFALNGRAGPRDREQSAKWLAAAAKLGHPEAAYDLALLYVEGQLFPQDFKRAAELLRQAADAGSPQAQYALGTFYKDGRGVPKDMAEAVKLWAAATLGDDTDAEVEYAIALYNGDGVTRDEDAAAAIFHKAAQHGSAIAQDRYARIMASGLGAERDPVKAVKWHLISRAAGETDITLDDFMASLPPATVAEGTKQAQPWLEALKEAQAAQAQAAAGPQPSPAPPAKPSFRHCERSNPDSSPSPTGGGRAPQVRGGLEPWGGHAHLPTPSTYPHVALPHGSRYFPELWCSRIIRFFGGLGINAEGQESASG
jgi:TPR repeat protein